jgi:hypothetical protein
MIQRALAGHSFPLPLAPQPGLGSFWGENIDLGNINILILL